MKKIVLLIICLIILSRNMMVMAEMPAISTTDINIDFSLLHSFVGGDNDGASPYGGLVSDGSTLFGMTYYGGTNDMGTVFSIDNNGNGFSFLYEFEGGTSDGAWPYGDLVLDGSILYGVTSDGVDDDHDVLFSMQTNGASYTTLHNFDGSAGGGYYLYTSPLLFNGVLFGMSIAGGNDDSGVIYSIQTNGAAYTNIHEFVYDSIDGIDPEFCDLLAHGARLYGMTTGGGTNRDGTIFSVKPDGTDYKILHNFLYMADDGAFPGNSLIADGDTLYGATESGGENGAGSVFRMNTNGTDFTVLKTFSYYDEGLNPAYVKLVSDGERLYGTTEKGGKGNVGTIFSVKPDGSEYTVLHSFTKNYIDGYQPYGGVIVTNGIIYGMTYYGGHDNEGVIYSLSVDGSGFKVIHAFAGNPDDGENPYGELVIYNNKLYGTTQYGGTNDRGVIFSVETNGANMAILHDFSDAVTDGRFSRGGLIVAGDLLCGMTQSGGSDVNGTIFSIKPDGSGFSLLHSFTGGSGDGQNPYRDLLFASGKLYGMTQYGGPSNDGVLFSIQTNGVGYTNMHFFAGGDSDGRSPIGNLIADDAGTTLYGSTMYGGTNDVGILFSIQADGSGYSNLYSCVNNTNGAYYIKGTPVLQNGRLYTAATGYEFRDNGAVFSISTNGTDMVITHSFSKASAGGRSPVGRLVKDGNVLYGVLKDGGSKDAGAVFAMRTDGAVINYLHDFAGGPDDGELPRGSLILINNTLYGTTVEGGISDKGIIFKLDVEGMVYPYVTITTLTQTVNYAVTSIVIDGTNSADAVGNMTVSNAANGEVYSFAAQQNWTSPAVTLITGENQIIVTVTNQIGLAVTDSVVITRADKLSGDSSVIYYVSTNGADVAPFVTWKNAATDIQSAVDIAFDDDIVLVTNGVYNTGGSVATNSVLMNRVAVFKSVMVKSVNGYEYTFIEGAPDPVLTNGPAAVRGVRLADGATLSGFTVTNGHTLDMGNMDIDCGAGGVFLYYGGTVTNCVIAGNSCYGRGGGVNGYNGGTIKNSSIHNNHAFENGGGIMINNGNVSNCEIYDNYSDAKGGGIYLSGDGTVYNCLIAGNTAGYTGGGVYFSGDDASVILGNCTVVSNNAYYYAGGINLDDGSAENCIIYDNIALNMYDNWNCPGALSSIEYTCTTPSTNTSGGIGAGCITNNPMFIGNGNYHPVPGSPCVDTGNNAYIVSGMDLDGTPLPLPLDGDADGTAVVDMGCYEYLNRAADSDGDTMSDGWEDDYGLNPAIDDAAGNPDNDPQSNVQEYIADTDPNDSNSYFCVTAISNNSPVTVYFDSSSNRLYGLLWNSSLITGNWSQVSGKMGVGGADSMQDTNIISAGNYRLSVEIP